MERRPTTPAELFEDMGYSPLDWPGKTTRLRRDSVQDVRQRLASTNVALGELYHENSKLYPSRCEELAASRLDPDAVRLAFLRRRAETKKRTSSPDAERFAAVRPLLSAATRSGRAPLFYALELRVADDALVARHEPLMDTLVVLKATALEEYAALRRGLELLSPTSTSPSAFLFIVASFVRNEVLYGARGYRRTLIEAGQLAEIITMEADRLQIPVRPILEFHDRSADGFIEVDGIEQGTVLILEVGGEL
jgi:hypothetical protein